MNLLKLTLKKKWFDMIASGEKSEEYREIKPYWISRLLLLPEMDCANYIEMCADLKNPMHRHESFDQLLEFFEAKIKQYDYIEFRNGYRKDSPTVIKKFGGLQVGIGNPNHGAPPDLFVFKLILLD